MDTDQFSPLEREHIEDARPHYESIIRLLRGRSALWHRTSLDSLQAILGSGSILPNTGQFEYTYPQSRACYGAHTRAVCLFDFDSASVDDALYQSLKWSSFLTDRGDITVWIEIDRAPLDPKLLKSSLDFRGKDNLPIVEESTSGRVYVPTFIPRIEAWYRAAITANAFVRYFLFAKPTGSVISRSVSVGDRTYATVESTAAEWQKTITHQREAHMEKLGVEWATVPPDPDFDRKMKEAQERVYKVRRKGHPTLHEDSSD